MNFLAELREVARVCPKPEARKALKDAADTLAACIVIFADEPTQGHMTTLNGAWIHAVRVLGSTPPLGGDGLNQGGVALNEEQRRAA